jgi:HK97 family phage major capsid protein
MSTEKETMKLEFNAGSFSVNAAGPDGTPKRTVEGVAVEWNTVATVQSGQRVKFLPGSLPTDGPAPKFMLDHSPEKPLGMVFERTDTGEAMLFAARVGPGAARDEVLAMAGPGEYYDSVSVGVEPIDYTFGKVGTDDENVMIVKSGRWMELSLLPFGAFATAKVASVEASEPEETEEPTPTDSEEEPAVATQETPAAVEAAVPTNIVYASAAKKETRLPSAAEYISAMLQGGEAFEKVSAQLKAAAPENDTTTAPGTLPVELTTPIYNGLVGRRPVIDAIGTRTMPQYGATYRVPYVSTHNSVAQQAAQFDTLQASLYGVSSYDVTKLTFGGYAVLSEQLLDFSSPEIVGSLLDDMARVYAFETDNYCADQLLATTTQSAVLTDPTSPAEWVSDIYDATVTIINNSLGNVPTHLFVSPNMFGALGKLVDTTGRPLLAPTMPMNAYGSMNPTQGQSLGQAFGLTVVVDRGFAADTVIVGDPSGFQIWEQQKGAIQAEGNTGVSQLSRTLAFRGYLATRMVDATKFVKLT